MNKEQQELLDEVYENYLNEWTFEKYPNDGSVYNVDPIKVKEHTKPQFEYRCKTDDEFSEKWGLTIEERELSFEERTQLYNKTLGDGFENKKWVPNQDFIESRLKTDNIPTKLITISYNDKTIESYE
jgi:hypothetical protein